MSVHHITGSEAVYGHADRLRAYSPAHGSIQSIGRARRTSGFLHLVVSFLAVVGAVTVICMVAGMFGGLA